MSVSRVVFLLSAGLLAYSAAADIPASDVSHVLVAAHRGGYETDRTDQAPENSVANVSVAIQKGYDVFETDIQRTKDGVFVIVHDETIDRETTGTGRASDLTLAELKALKKRYRDGSVSEQPVATLEELLIAGKDQILFKPDLKPGIIEHFDDLAQLITRLDMTDQVMIRTGYGDANTVLKYFESGTPRLEVMFRLSGVKQVNEINEMFSPRTVEIKLAKGEAITSGKRTAIERALELGILVETHSYGDETTMTELANLGVRMFHTAIPARTLSYLEQSGWR